MALRPVFKAGIGRLRRLIGRCAAAPGSPWSAEKGLSTGGMRVSWAFLHRRYDVLLDRILGWLDSAGPLGID
jgi:hypothetical protein